MDCGAENIADGVILLLIEKKLLDGVNPYLNVDECIFGFLASCIFEPFPFDQTIVLSPFVMFA